MTNVPKLTLPFVTSAKDRALSFTEEMEAAVIFYFAESARKKGEGMILKKPAEELAFISKLYYPIWLAPRIAKTLLFDGLGVSRSTLSYGVLPDVKAFVNDVNGCGGKRQAYEAALGDHAHSFESVKSSEERTISGLILGAEFAEDFSRYLKESEDFENSGFDESVCLTPVVDESLISSGLSDLTELKAALDEDVQNLAEAMKLIHIITREHTDTIRGEIKNIQTDMNRKIAFANSLATEKVRGIKERYDLLVLKTADRFEKRLQVLHQKKVGLDKSQDRAVSQVDRCLIEIMAFRNRKDARGERRWKEEKNKWRREFLFLKKSVEDLETEISEVESQKAIEISDVRAEFNAKANDALENVRELEAERDSKVKLSCQEVSSLSDLTSSLLAQMDGLSMQKKAALVEIQRMGMQEQRRKRMLVYVPFYLSCFQSGPQQRYAVYPPSVVGNMRTITKLKGMLGMSKVRSLFQPYSSSLANVLNQVVTLIEQNPVFEKEVHDISQNANILQSPETRERIKRGLADLRNENWLSPNESQILSNSF